MEKTEDLIAEIEGIIENPNNSENKNSLSNPSEENKLKKVKKDYWPCSGQLGGARPGAGMPKGKVTVRTIQKRDAERYFKDRVIRSVGKLVDSQMNLARGCQFLMKIEKEYDKTTKCWKTKKNARPIIVKDKEEIANYLAGDYDNKPEADYYFMTTERPDNRALDSLLDRTFGRAVQNIKGDMNLTMHDLLNELE